MEMGLSLLAQSHLPNQFWVDAFLMSTYIINCLPMLVLSNDSPFSKLFHQTPGHMVLRVFGCACYPLLRPYFRSKQCIFLGFTSNHRGYRCFDPLSQRAYLSQNVRFDENLFPTRHRSPPFQSTRVMVLGISLIVIDFKFDCNLLPFR
jgi:hypothetical protein